MLIDIRRHFVTVDTKSVEAGRWHEKPVIHATVGLVIANPYAGRYVEDLGEMIAASEALGRRMGQMLVAAMGGEAIEGYGKAGVVGLGGELEHANALLTTTFANPIRDAIGGALAWIPSFTKRAAPGAAIDIPLAHKDALYVRSHYDGVSLTLPPETPDADEVVLLFAASNRGRLNARVGGLTSTEVRARDGLR